MSVALLIAAIPAVLRHILVYVVVIVALKTDNPDRRRTALAILRILRPFAEVWKRKKN